ncbi:hypothetical protein HanXRQr2_Chr17g0788641 [Helianthus annuus]|uniref:Uncharacterized protein n=1 Tax=Helianthus annuus TaxID=4232 RepID=A0A9K3DH59_HELAN|nr:hypothetical protein HanXRQr2_Chr17g0788641 [Helianthus annuus]
MSLCPECRILTPYDGESNYKHVGRNGRSNRLTIRKIRKFSCH